MVTEAGAQERRLFLSEAPAGRPEYRLALAAMLVSAACFLAAAPFAKQQLAEVWAFIPVYQSALVVGDIVTALLLFGQYGILRTRSLLILACAYLFTALMAAVHALTFPGLFAATGLLGAGGQSTAWLYMFWHAGFPLAVIVHAWPRAAQPASGPVAGTGAAVARGLAVVLALVCGLTLLATAGQALLPPIMQGNRYTPAMLGVVGTVWGLSVAALLLLWRKRAHTVLDLLLMVTMCAWVFEIGLSAVLNGGRFDLGFYAGRLYGLLAANAVLGLLIVENTRLYAGLAAAYDNERRERERVQRHAQELAALNQELDAFSHSVSHDLQAPLRAVEGFSRILEEDHAAQLDAEGQRLVGVIGDSARTMAQLIRDLLNFSRLGRQPVQGTMIDMNALAAQAIDGLRQAEGGAGGIHAQCEIAPLPTAWGDRALLRQVWVNLISNAFKYSGTRAQPRIRIGARVEGNECIYSVQDDGVGFDMKYYDRLFGMFKRLHRADEFPGNGVGLAIVQRIVARHGGRVWAVGKLNEGASFYFALPLRL